MWQWCELSELGSGLRMAERSTTAKPAQHSAAELECLPVLRAGAA